MVLNASVKKNKGKILFNHYYMWINRSTCHRRANGNAGLSNIEFEDETGEVNLEATKSHNNRFQCSM